MIYLEWIIYFWVVLVTLGWIMDLRETIDVSIPTIFNTLFLLTNKKCEAAIHLYEKNGFVHCEEIMQKFGCAYERCDVAMHYKGTATK